MKENKLIKNVTTDQLAEMIQKGFDGVDKRFDKVEVRLDKVEVRLDKIDQTLVKIHGQLGNKVDKQEFEKLEGRVEYLEGVK